MYIIFSTCTLKENISMILKQAMIEKKEQDLKGACNIDNNFDIWN